MSTAEEIRQAPGAAGATLPIVVHGALWTVVLAIMVLFVPRFEAIFNDLGHEHPGMAWWTLILSAISIDYWFFVLPFFLLLTVAVGAVLYILCLVPGAAVLRKIWICAMLMIPVAVIAFTFVATLLAMFSSVDLLG